MDKKESLGTYTYPDGRVYEGNWLEGKQHGFGTFTNKAGVSRRGTWENG